MPATNTGAMAPQTSPYSAVYGGAAPAGTPTASYPTTNTPGTSAPINESITTGPSMVNNAYANPPADNRYASAPSASYGSGVPDASPAAAAAPAGDRYASNPAPASGGEATRYDGRYDSAPTATYPSTDRNSAAPEAAAAAPPADAAAGDRYARDNYQPGNYQPGNTGYEPGNTGYNPPGVAPYRGAEGAVSATTPSPRRDPFYRPGGTKDYHSASGGNYVPSGAAPANRIATPASGVRPAAYDAAPAGAMPNTVQPPPSYTGDRYGTAPSSRY